MDISGIDIGAAVAAIGALAKSFHSDSKAKSEKEELTHNFGERFIRVETKQSGLEKRLDDCFAKFDSIDEQLRTMNRTLSELTGIIKAMSTRANLLEVK